MKRIFYLLAMVLLANNVQAGNGDTTWVQAQYNVQMPNFGNYDSTVNFPDGSKTYRKIYMIFTLGKYACPGNPQYCSDWDYTVQNVLMTPGGDTLELARLITPYGNSSRMQANWKGPYVFDVTDFYPVLKNTGTIRVHYSGYSGGFTSDVKFAFIEGTPERDVLGIDRLWHGSFAYGKAAPIDDAVQSMNKTAPANTQAAELKFNITGHGSDNSGCSEFCKKYYQVKVNGSQVDQTDIWRDDCGYNELYPQNGTWVYDRGNWCPGASVHINTHKLAAVSAGNAYDIDVDFEAHSSSGNNASYIIEGQVFYYGGMNKTTDASLDDIIAPSNDEFHFRENDLCGTPKIKVKNTGSAAITSMKIEYGVAGTTLSEYTWQGSLASLAETEITLPEPYELRELSLKDITANGTFVAKLVSVNGQADEDATNNEMTSTFKPVPHWPSRVVVNMNTNKSEVGGVSETSWKIYFLDGNIAAERSNAAISTAYRDTINLGPGCYKMVVEDKGCDGVNWWVYPNYPVNPGAGSIQVKIPTGGAIGINLPLKGYYNGDFGCGFTQYFTVGWPSSVENVNLTNQPGMEVYPNPAREVINVSLSGVKNVDGMIQMVDAIGRVVMEQDINTPQQQINTSSLTNGIYTIIFRDDKGGRLQSRVVIAH